MLVAITRGVSPSISQCELTYVDRTPINLELACRQHEQYTSALASLGVEINELPADSALPDSVFIEDAAIVLDECAILARPGAKSRRGEVAAVADALLPFREMHRIQAPATLDGGDVLCLGKRIIVGQSKRSNAFANEQLRILLSPMGYTVEPVEITACLHLQSAVTAVAADTVLVNPRWIDARIFRGFKLIEVDPSEPDAANALLIDQTVLFQVGFPKTAGRLAAAGIRLQMIDLSELAKAEGALTCCSLIFQK